MSLLTTIQNATKELSIAVPTAVVSSTSTTTKQLLALTYEVADEARMRLPWPELTRVCVVTLVANQANYQLPYDFDAMMSETMWNQSDNWCVDGPIGAQEWRARKDGIVSSTIHQKYRIKGVDSNQLFIDPVPTSKKAGGVTSWVGNTSTNSFTVTGDYTGTSALSYRVKIDDAVSSPNTFTWSDDGGVTWDATGVAITGSAQTLNNGFSITFDSTTGGVLNDYWDFASGETIIFEYQSLNWIRPPSWADSTSYAAGGYCYGPDSNGIDKYWKTTLGGASSGTTPADDTGVTDWVEYYIPATSPEEYYTVAKTAAYESFVTDSDVSLLHERSVISLGLKWMWKAEKGFPFEVSLSRWEDQIRRRFVSMNGSRTLNMATGRSGSWFLNYHNIPDGGYG